MTSSSNVPVFDRPKVIIYRFIDVLVTEGRMKHDFMNMASANLQPFLEEFFLQKDLLELVADLREQSYEERERNPNLGSPIVFKATQTPAAIIGSLCFYINWRMKKNNKQADLGKPKEPDYKLIKWVVSYAMATGTGTITVHDRFAEALKKRHAEGIQQFVYSRLASGTVDTERKLLAFTSAGDLTPYISGYFSPDFLNPNDEMSYNLMVDCLGVPSTEVMLITTRLDECRLATEAGFMVVKVKRPNEEKNRTFARVKDMSAMNFKPFPPAPVPSLPEQVVPQSLTQTATPHLEPSKSTSAAMTTESKPMAKKIATNEKVNSIISMRSTLSMPSKTSGNDGSPAYPIISKDIKSGLLVAKTAFPKTFDSKTSNCKTATAVTSKVSKRAPTLAVLSNNKKTDIKAKGSSEKNASKIKSKDEKKNSKRK